MIGHTQTAGYVVAYPDDGLVELWARTIHPTVERAQDDCAWANSAGGGANGTAAVFALVPLTVFAGGQ